MCGVCGSGVNMYAMLTGTLPFTVEPFSLRALHQKMVDKEMNPLPPSLSTGRHPPPQTFATTSSHRVAFASFA